MKQMYSGVKSCSFLNGKNSPYFTPHEGIRKDKILSPLLFALFINDIEEFVLDFSGNY